MKVISTPVRNAARHSLSLIRADRLQRSPYGQVQREQLPGEKWRTDITWNQLINDDRREISRWLAEAERGDIFITAEGQHRIKPLAVSAFPELLTNPDLINGVTGWTATSAILSTGIRRLRVENTSASLFASAQQTISLLAGQAYLFIAHGMIGNHNLFRLDVVDDTAIATVTSAPTNGGTGYTVNDVLTITEGTGGTVTATAVSAGIITAVSLTTSGSGYTTGAGKATTGGTGTGATIEILTLSAMLRAIDTTVDGFIIGSFIPLTTRNYRIRLMSRTAPIGSHVFYTGISLARSACVDGANQTGRAVKIKDLDASVNSILTAGDFVTFMTDIVNGGANPKLEMKRLTADLNSDSAGKGWLYFEPPMRSTTMLDSAPVMINRPRFYSFFPNPNTPMATTNPLIGSLSVTLEEDILAP